MQHYISQFVKILMKLVVDFEKQRKDMMNNQNSDYDKFKAGRSNSIRQNGNPEDQNIKWIQKTLIIHLLKDMIQNVILSSEPGVKSRYVNDILKPELIKAYLIIKKKNKNHRSLLILLEMLGDPEIIIAEYKENLKSKSLEREDEIDLVSTKSQKMLNHLNKNTLAKVDLTGKTGLSNVNLTTDTKYKLINPTNMITEDEGKKDKQRGSELNFSVLSELPGEKVLKRNHEKLLFQPQAVTMGKYKVRSKLTKNEERALREIEKVKLRRQRRLEDKLFEEERKQLEHEKIKRKLKNELDKRKVQHGVYSVGRKKFQKNKLILDITTETDRPIREKSAIELYDFSLEESKDKNDVHNFLK